MQTVASQLPKLLRSSRLVQVTGVTGGLLRNRAAIAVPVRWSSSDASSFDIFQKIKDPPGEGADGAAKRRKPSDRVIKLVDDIMNLTLIEAADLCDLCQEKLAERSGGPSFTGQAAAGRTPFPHPAGMFAGMGAGGMPGMMPPMMPMMGQMPQMMMPPGGMPPMGAAPAQAAAPAAEAAPAAAPASKESPAAKSVVSIKLVKVTDPAKKVAVIKEVRTITALGLKEAKDLVDGAPKILKKGVAVKEAEELMKKLTEAGAEVLLE